MLIAHNILKCAVKYKENDFAFWVDGTLKLAQIHSGYAFTTDTLNDLNFNLSGMVMTSTAKQNN